MMPDTDKLNEFLSKFVNDLGGALHAGMVVIGDKLGLYRALAAKPLTSQELAQKTETDERYVREWLNSQAAGGYVEYDRTSHKYGLTPEQAFALAVEDSPAFIPGAFVLATGALAAVERVTEAFRTGAGMGWHEHHTSVFEGCEKFFRPGYAANLVSAWIPAFTGLEAKLSAGARIADVGCGHGASTILLAQAYRNSRVIGFDYHEGSIQAARAAAERAAVADRVRFEVAQAKDFPGEGYDLVTAFDCLHDLGDPVGAARHVLASLNRDGHFMIVEPFANDEVADNLNPVGRVYYAGSTLLCTPCSRSQEVGLCLGAQAGEARIHSVVRSAGFSSFRRAAATPFNLVYEARP
ncbi:MAG TPA: class I SAM-dependent methyltransferase [Polyangiaceae bacterium]|nr:class I SAM-dependent methyltransferase [Polyangiaceae bacterium]